MAESQNIEYKTIWKDEYLKWIYGFANAQGGTIYIGKDDNGNDLPKTVISREYSSEWKVGDEPYYPVNDEKNGALYAEYKKLAENEKNVVFGGRLGEYKYYDMDQVIAVALAMSEKLL